MNEKEPLIEKTPGYRVGQQFFPMLREAQIAALNNLLGCDTDAKTTHLVVDHAEEVIAILSMPGDKPPRKKESGQCVNGRVRHHYRGAATCKYCGKANPDFKGAAA